MKRILLLLLCVMSALCTSRAFGARAVIPLDGTWQIAQGALTDDIPQTFDRSIAVPGLADMVTPAFTEVGVPSAQRQAFWYKRTFRVSGPRRAVAILKINKAMFGTKVWLNGSLVGEHFGCFTPGYFDISKALRYDAENTLVVRVATRDSAPKWLPTGTDYEKTMWQPGIYDSVSLSLMDSTYISSVQVAPHIADGTATVQVVVKHVGDTPIQAQLGIAAVEWKSARPASTPIRHPMEFDATGEQTVTATIRLKRSHLWSPEDPFLYVMRCSVGSDIVQVRFGMREFHYDPKTGRAMLNGKPYYLRGTDFCMFRFFEDPLRGSLPWNREWARKVLTQPKKLLHWNSARVCIAPFPEFWYDIADETGWLLQDEYPIWGFHDEWSQDELTTEFREWLQERWNHPSIAAWDACNETLTPRTGELIKATRGMDLSNRPWDNGYSPRDRPTDAIELHPYTAVGDGGGAARIGSAMDKSFPALAQGPLIINEYDAFWMARDGGGTSWFKKWYEDTLGTKATLDQKRELLAYNAAVVSEYWRARRQAAGVQWFCYLSYSKPHMVTSDNFSDIRSATIEPHFVDYMRNAFAPLAVAIDDAETQYAPSVKESYRIIVTNDLDTPQSGAVVLRLSDGAKDVRTQSAKFSVKALGQSVISMDMALPSKPGNYLLVAELAPARGEHVKSRRKVQIVTPDEARHLVSLSDHCPVTASSEFPGCPARFAVDRRGSTRWSSQFSDPQWISVDLGRPMTVSRVGLDWETAYGETYRIQVSDDGHSWTDVYLTDEGKGGREEIRFAPVTARYVRLYGMARGTEWGYSLWSLQVFEK